MNKLLFIATKPKKKVISNDELMYDPDLDDKDEEWVSKQIDSKV